MSTHTKRAASIFSMAVAAIVFAFAAVKMLQKQDPFYTWFYCFAWWSFILFGQSLLYFRFGESTLFCRPKDLFLWLPLSITIWLIFEAFNFRLNNWSYINVPSSKGVRWGGYALSFATVLPGIFTMKSLLELSLSTGKVRRSPSTPSYRFGFILIPIGVVSLLLPILWPAYFFPLVWIGFIFLLDPLNLLLGGRSLLSEARHGSYQNLVFTLAAGMLCGILWEFWNYWAGSKWIYTIPYVDWIKVFEMPFLGFFGFPPFAIECLVMTNFLTIVMKRMKQLESPRTKGVLTISAILLVVLFDLLVFSGIDRFTVISYRN